MTWALTNCLVYAQKLLSWLCATDFLLNSCPGIVQANPEAGLHVRSSKSCWPWQCDTEHYPAEISNSNHVCDWRDLELIMLMGPCIFLKYDCRVEFFIRSQTVNCPTSPAVMHPQTKQWCLHLDGWQLQYCKQMDFILHVSFLLWH